MHGILLKEFKDFICKKLGIGGWEEVRKDSGVETTLFTPVQSYPESQLAALLSSAAEHLGTSSPALLEEFGKFFIPGFMRSRAFLFDPQWDFLDALERSDAFVKAVLTKRIVGGDPPTITVTRDGPNQATMHYQSKRKLCAMTKGMIKGLAHHYRTEIDIREPRCMLKGAAECELIVTVISRPPPKPTETTTPDSRAAPPGIL